MWSRLVGGARKTPLVRKHAAFRLTTFKGVEMTLQALSPQREPAVWIGILFAVLLAVVQSLAGNGILGQDIADTIALAIDPTRNGWAIPIAVGIVTKFFTKPATEPSA